MNAPAPWRVALCAGAFAAGVAAAPHGLVLVVLVAASAGTAVVATCRRLRTMTTVVAVLACLAGGWRSVGALAADGGPGSVAGHLGAGDTVLRGTVGDAGVPGRDDTIVVEVRQLATHAGSWAVSGGVVAEPRTPVRLLPGDLVEVETTSLRAPPQRPGSLSAVALERVGVSAIASAAVVTQLASGPPSPARLAQELRGVLSGVVTRVLPEPDATLLLGIAFGIHGRLTGAVRTPLQDAGLIHLVAVSGLKVVLVVGLIESLARTRAWSRRRRTLLTLSVVGLYVVLSGAGAAALRSSLMVAAGLILGRDGRRPHSFALLAVCAALLLGIEPAVATDVGFQLSFLGTAGILILASPIAARLPGPRALADPFAVTLAAQLATAPVTAGTFGVLSLVGPLANSLVLPLVPAAIVTGGAGALLGVVSPALGWLPLEVGGMLAGVVMAAARGASSLPMAALPVQLWPSQWTLVEVAAAGGALVARYVCARWMPTARSTVPAALGAAALVGAIATAAVSATSPQELRVTVLDVGNGVAVLVSPPGGGAVLVDGGADGAALLTALGRVLSPLDRHLDAVVLTATNRAAAAAVPALIGQYDVGALVVAQSLPPALERTAALLAGTGTRVVAAGAAPWSVGGLWARCIPSGPGPSDPCVLLLGTARSTALVTGNLTQVAQDELAGVQGSRLRCDVLVAPTTTAPSTALLASTGAALVAVPAARTPPGLGSSGLTVAVTGRDSDLEYDALASGGFSSPSG